MLLPRTVLVTVEVETSQSLAALRQVFRGLRLFDVVVRQVSAQVAQPAQPAKRRKGVRGR